MMAENTRAAGATRALEHGGGTDGGYAVRLCMHDETPPDRRTLGPPIPGPDHGRNAPFGIARPPAEAAVAGGTVTSARCPAPTALDLYLREIVRAPLLTRERVTALARRIDAGDAGAAEELVAANLRLVVGVARRYRHCGLPLEDLIGEGNMGLLRAVRTYDWRRDCAFSTYAVWWIREAIARGVANSGHTIRVPVHAGEKLRRRERTAPVQDRDGDATSRDVVSPTLEAAAAAMRGVLSLDRSPDGDGDGEPLAALVADETSPGTEDEAVRRVSTDDARRVLAEVLTARERTVLVLRFGLDGGSPMTLEVVGARLGLTRERARQIESGALDKLRRPSVVARLRPY